MSNDNASGGPPSDRRGSFTSAAFSNLFHRSNSTSTNGNLNGNSRESVSAAVARDQRRRLSVTTLGLSGASPPSANTPFGLRRGSISTTNSDCIDENAIEDDEPAKIPSGSSFARRTSFGAQAMLNMRTGQTSPGSDNGYNWTEQLRFRAESSVAGQRPAFGSAATPGSPPRGTPHHDRAKSVSDMPAPPRQPEVMKPRQPERPKPDHMQERILKGDFYMD